ncbi:unnamed protein product [Closterium sp. Yama58-4]|nr:unnamed protein product [Closterium sp. Yama58-4]
MGIMVSVCRHIVELAPAWTTRPDGSRFEVMRRSVRADLRIQLPALSQLDTMLLTILQHSQSDEYYYEDELPERPATHAGPYGTGGMSGRIGGVGGDGGERGGGGRRGVSHGSAHGSAHGSVHGSGQGSGQGSSVHGSSTRGSSADEEEDFADDEGQYSQGGEFEHRGALHTGNTGDTGGSGGSGDGGDRGDRGERGSGHYRRLSSPGFEAERRGSEEDLIQQRGGGGGGGEAEDACSSGSNTGSNAGSNTGSREGSSPNPGSSSWGFHQRSSSTAAPAAPASSSGVPSGASPGSGGKRRVSSRSSSFSYDFSALLGGGRSRSGGGSVTAAGAAGAASGAGGGIPPGGSGIMRGLKRSVTDVRDKRFNPESMAGGGMAGMGGMGGVGGMGGGGGEGAGGGRQVWRWKMKPRVRGPLGEALVRWLEQQMEKTSQIMKLAMTINQQVLQDMQVPDAFVQRLPKNVRAVVGDRVYAALHANPFTDDKLLSTADLSNQKAALKLACKLEAAEQIWMRQLALAREPQLSTLGGSYLSTSSRDMVRLEESLQRVSSCLAAIRRRWPDLPQTTLDLAKIAFNGDIGKAVLESYSRVLEGAASNIRSRIRDVLHANYLFLNPQQLVDVPCDPHPQGLRHPTFSVLMPETVFDAVSMSSDNSESTNGSDNNGASSKGAFSRRTSLLLAASAGALLADWSVLPAAQALPFLLPLSGFRLYVDRLDGYSFFYPDSWIEVRGSGQDCFFRSSFNLDENVSVEVSSPSSSRFASVRDLGDPQAAGQRVEKQLLTEFMSTRLGVRREATLISSASRIVPAGTRRRGAGEQEEDAEYYDVELNVKSYANNNQMAIMPDERVQVLEWNRRYLIVLAVANRRLYQLRLQVPERLLDSERPVLRQVMDSFRVFSVAE